MFETKVAPGVHILAAGCIYFSTCAPGGCKAFPIFEYLNDRQQEAERDLRYHTLFSSYFMHINILIIIIICNERLFVSPSVHVFMI